MGLELEADPLPQPLEPAFPDAPTYRPTEAQTMLHIETLIEMLGRKSQDRVARWIHARWASSPAQAASAKASGNAFAPAVMGFPLDKEMPFDDVTRAEVHRTGIFTPGIGEIEAIQAQEESPGSDALSASAALDIAEAAALADIGLAAVMTSATPAGSLGGAEGIFDGAAGDASQMLKAAELASALHSLLVSRPDAPAQEIAQEMLLAWSSDTIKATVERFTSYYLIGHSLDDAERARLEAVWRLMAKTVGATHRDSMSDAEVTKIICVHMFEAHGDSPDEIADDLVEVVGAGRLAQFVQAFTSGVAYAFVEQHLDAGLTNALADGLWSVLQTKLGLTYDTGR